MSRKMMEERFGVPSSFMKFKLQTNIQKEEPKRHPRKQSGEVVVLNLEEAELIRTELN